MRSLRASMARVGLGVRTYQSSSEDTLPSLALKSWGDMGAVDNGSPASDRNRPVRRRVRVGYPTVWDFAVGNDGLPDR